LDAERVELVLEVGELLGELLVGLGTQFKGLDVSLEG
jgi:hypothetical protein